MEKRGPVEIRGQFSQRLIFDGAGPEEGGYGRAVGRPVGLDVVGPGGGQSDHRLFLAMGKVMAQFFVTGLIFSDEFFPLIGKQ